MPDGKEAARYATSMIGSRTNSVLFLDGILAFFGSTDYIRALGGNVLDILMVLGLGNALAEVLVCTLIGGSLGNACAFP